MEQPDTIQPQLEAFKAFVVQQHEFNAKIADIVKTQASQFQLIVDALQKLFTSIEKK